MPFSNVFKLIFSGQNCKIFYSFAGSREERKANGKNAAGKWKIDNFVFVGEKMFFAFVNFSSFYVKKRLEKI